MIDGRNAVNGDSLDRLNASDESIETKKSGS